MLCRHLVELKTRHQQACRGRTPFYESKTVWLLHSFRPKLCPHRFIYAGTSQITQVFNHQDFPSSPHSKFLWSAIKTRRDPGRTMREPLPWDLDPYGFPRDTYGFATSSQSQNYLIKDLLEFGNSYPFNTNETKLHNVLSGNVGRMVDNSIPFHEAKLQKVSLPELAGHHMLRARSSQS